MNLYLIHCGFYDPIAGDGIYELHTNLFVIAQSVDDARSKAKLLTEYRQKKMHIDGIQEIIQVDGYRLEFKPARSADSNKTIIHSTRSTFARIKKAKTA